MELSGDLATSVESNDDLTEWVVDIRDDATFSHNGQTVKAKDVAATCIVLLGSSFIGNTMGEHLQFIGIFLALLTAVLTAIHHLSVRVGTDEGKTYDAVIVVMIINTALLLPLILFVYYPEYGLSSRSWLAFIAAGVFGTMLGRAFMYTSIDRIGASRTVPIFSSWAVFSTLLGIVVLHESISLVHGAAVFLIVGSVAIIAWETSHENPDNLPKRELLTGLLIPLGGAFIYAWEPIFANVGFASGTPAPVGLAVKTVAATIGFSLYLWWRNLFPRQVVFRSSDFRWYTIGGVASTLAHLTYYVALDIAPVSVVAPLTVTSTLFVILFSALFMPKRLERITLRLVTAATGVVVGVVLLTVYG